MPLYIYANDETKEFVEVYQGINDEHKFFDESGREWRRVFTPPQVSTKGSNSLDAWDLNGFVNKTGDMKGSVGDLWQAAEELSEKRAERTGEDPYKKKTIENYEKKTKRKHYTRYGKSFTKNGIKVEY